MADISKLLQEVIDQRPAANGLAIIVANAHSCGQLDVEPLRGVHKDLQAMKATFEELRFATFPIYDATARQIKDLVKAAAHPSGVARYPPSYKRLVFAFAGHGDVGVIYTHTEPVDLLHDVIEPFHPVNSPHIGDFPKLFFIDSCRGTQEPDRGVEVPIPRGANDKSQILPSEGNFLLAYSTLSNMKAYEKDGGLWMQTVAKMLREERDSVGDVLQKVNQCIIKKFSDLGYPLQQPIFESTLNSDPFSLRKEADELNRRCPNVHLYFPPQKIYNGCELEVQHSVPGPDTSQWPPVADYGQSPLEGVVGGAGVHDQIPFGCLPPSVPCQSTQWSGYGQAAQPTPLVPNGITFPTPSTGVAVCPPATGQYGAAVWQHLTELHEQTHDPTTHGNHGTFQPLQPLCPQYEYIEDHSRGQSRYKCSLKVNIDGCHMTVSGGYHATSTSATQEAERKLAMKSFLEGLQSRSSAVTKCDYVSKLEQYFKLKGIPSPNIHYRTKDHHGYQSTVFAPGMGSLPGEVCSSREAAKQNAALHMLQKIQKYAD